ncbi:TM1266 family iron-only hydrogenase system putative regulator [Sediminispirochaeta bajacaliforniensis]|nr:TM1266 family iron-only hydrogenase system putative regulator [Sediminispirochaeta bajacaliforniensis]
MADSFTILFGSGIQSIQKIIHTVKYVLKYQPAARVRPKPRETLIDTICLRLPSLLQEGGTRMEKRLGFIGIIIENRNETAGKVQELLTDFGDQIVCRTGVPYREKGLSVITLIVDTTTDALGSLTGKLGAIEGVSVKSSLAKK